MKKRALIIILIYLIISSFLTLTADENTKPAPSKTKNKTTLKFRGYLQGWYVADFTEEISSSSFLIKRARLGAAGTLTNHINYTLMVDFAQTENILLDAYADIKIKKGLAIRFGQHKTPFSRINLRSASKLYLIERPFYQKNLTPPIRDIGLQVSYNHPQFQLSGGIYNGEGRTKADSDGIKHLSLRGELKAIPHLNIAFNIYVSHKEIGIEDDRLKMYGFDFHYQFSPFFIECEVVKRQVNLIGALNGTGYYLMVGGKFNSEKRIIVEPVIRYEYFDTRAPFLGVQEWQIIGGLSIYNKAGNVKLSMNGAHINGGISGETINKFLTQLQLVF